MDNKNYNSSFTNVILVCKPSIMSLYGKYKVIPEFLRTLTTRC